MDQTGRDPAEDQENEPGQMGIGGASPTRGPAVRPGGESDTGDALVPPYPGRRETGDVDDEGPPEADANVGGATGPVRADEEAGED